MDSFPIEGTLLYTLRIMEIFWSEVTHGIPDREMAQRMLIRLTVAVICGAIIGLQRSSVGKSAGLRTHILVSAGTCIFILACIGGGFTNDSISRVIQGVVTGIGFLGAGSILKYEAEHQIHGLTTAAGVWMTSAIGVSAALGNVGLAIVSAVIGIVILAYAEKLEFKWHFKDKSSDG